MDYLAFIYSTPVLNVEKIPVIAYFYPTQKCVSLPLLDLCTTGPIN